jgi:hypothetical protein
MLQQQQQHALSFLHSVAISFSSLPPVPQLKLFPAAARACIAVFRGIGTQVANPTHH